MSRTGLGGNLVLIGPILETGVCSWSELEDPVDADWDTTERLVTLAEWPTFNPDFYPAYNAVSNNGVFLVNDRSSGSADDNGSISYSLFSSRLKQPNGSSVALPALNFTVNGPYGYEIDQSEYGSDISADGSAVAGTSERYVPFVEESCTFPFPCLGVVTDVDIHSQAFRWTQANGTQGLGYLPGGSSEPGSGANSISADGEVVAGWSSSTDGMQAFRWTESGGMVGLGDLPGGTFSSSAKDVSSDGTTVVGYGTSESGWEAFRWTEAGGMVGLGDLPGGVFYSQAVAVSADGVLVVGNSLSRCVPGSCSLYDPTHSVPFIWIYGIGMISMQDYLTLLGIDLTGWELYTVIGISDDGKTIVGTGKRGTVTTHWIASRVEAEQPSDMLPLLPSSEPAERLLPGDAYAQSGEAANTGSSGELTAPLSVENPVVLPPADTTLSSDVSPQPSVADSVVLTIVGIGEEPPTVTPPAEEPVVMTNGKRPRKVHAKPARATRKKLRK